MLLRVIDGMVERLASPIYTWLLILLYSTYISSIFGLWYVYPGSLHILTNATQIFIACVLILRFNPFRKTHLQPFDEHLIFASAITLLVNAGILVWLEQGITTTSPIPHSFFF